MELWPRRIVLGGGVAGREEEGRAPRVSGEDKPQGLVCWMRKELAELGHALLRWRGRWFDGKSSTEQWQRRQWKQRKGAGANSDG